MSILMFLCFIYDDLSVFHRSVKYFVTIVLKSAIQIKLLCVYTPSFKKAVSFKHDLMASLSS